MRHDRANSFPRMNLESLAHAVSQLRHAGCCPTQEAFDAVRKVEDMISYIRVNYDVLEKGVWFYCEEHNHEQTSPCPDCEIRQRGRASEY